MTAIHPSEATVDLGSSRSGFEIDDKPGLLTIRFGGESVLQFINEHVYFRAFHIMNARFRPGGPIELINLLSSAIYPAHRLLACNWACRSIGTNAVEIVLSASKVEGDLRKLVAEQRTYRIEYVPSSDRFVYTITVDLHFHADIRGDEGLHHTGMAQWPGDDYAVIEFDDPLLSGGVGPQVPMTQDWVGLYEPVLTSDGSTTAWKKRYFDVTFDTVLRGVRRLGFNREVNGVQRFYNRTLPVTRPGRPYIYRKIDGSWLRMTPLFSQPASHHICEWGYDMHFYALLPKAGDGLLFKTGQHVSLTYIIDEIDTAQVPRDYLGAKDAEIDPEERVQVDMPIYEEPVCRFTGSALDHPDAYAFDLHGDGHWNRANGGIGSGGSLELTHGAVAKESAWTFIHWGPSYACNPVPPLSHYQISAWIKADELDKVELSMEFVGYQGPATCSPRTVGRFTDSGRTVLEKRDQWVHVQFPAGPTPTFVLSGNFAFNYKGKGNAAMTGLSIKRL